MTCREIRPLRRIAGKVRVPGDKSISHRAVMIGALAEGRTEVRGFLESADCRATIDIFRALGVVIDAGKDLLLVNGRGLDALREPEDVLQAGNSGTSMRLVMGILAGLDIYAVITGDASLRRRPMDRVALPLSLRGASFRGRGERLLAPVALQGRRGLMELDYKSPVASAQVKTACLLSGLDAAGPTAVTEPLPSRDHSERMLRAFGADIESSPGRVLLRPGRRLQGLSVRVPGDISSAAFFLVLAAAIPGAELTVEGIGLNPTRSGILDVLKTMGAGVEISGCCDCAGEPAGDVRITGRPLKGMVIGAPLIPRLIDEIPVLAVAAALAEGETVIKDASELRVKETDRVLSVSNMLRAFGAVVVERPDGMVIAGGARLHGAEVDSLGDHRVAMAASVAALLADGASLIRDTACIDTSFPGFYEILEEVTGYV